MQGMRTVIALLFTAFVAAACSGAAPGPTLVPTAAPTPSVTASLRPTVTPAPTSSASPTAGFYLRGWYEQALPPDATFGQLPILTISEGVAIDGNVAIPAIYPGPIFVKPFARSISSDGQRMIADEARRLGLVGGTTDFTGGGAAPGSQIARLVLIVDGEMYDLSGPADPGVGCRPGECDADPGTPEAFSAFWQGLSMLDSWVGDELGATEPYEPERVAVLFTGPAQPEPGLPQQPKAWPLGGSFDQMGVEYPGAPGSRCITITGDELELAVPVLEEANQLTVFLDEADGQASANAVVVVPGAASPCDA
jgi:hypothetical protein